MSNDELVLLEEVSGKAQGEALRGLIEAQGIEVMLSQEAAGQSTFPVTYGILGSVKLFVRQQDEERAREILAEYYAGDFIDQDLNQDSDEKDEQES